MTEVVKYIGLDVHKETIAVAVADGERGSEVRYVGTVPNEDDAIRNLVKRLTGSGAKLNVCYEAGPCGYGLHRLLTKLGQSCIVIAPSMMPRRPGDHVKTDRRDAMTLARLLRAGELTAIWMPDDAHEAVRDLTSQRDAGVRWTIAGDVKLVAGVFDVRKPYLSLDPTGLFMRLGDTRNRGIEASLSGTPLRGLSVALGGVFLDPQVTGEARTSGQTGKRPVGVPFRSVDFNLDWRLPGFEALSFDLGVGHQGRVASTVNNDLFIPARTLVDVGSRYRFTIGKNRATLRVSVSNIFNVYAWDYYGPSTFDYVPQRLATAYLAVDF